MRRFPVGLTILAVLAFAALCALGTWQLRRLAWKQDMVARVAAARTADPKPVAMVLEAGERGADVDFTRVEIACPGLASAPWAELYSLKEGQPGARLISPCRLPAGRWSTILVDRGFVSETISARPPVDAADRRSIRVVGVLREPGQPSPFVAKRDPGGRFHSREVGPIARSLGAERPAPWMLMAETSSNQEWRALQPSALPTGLSNRHLEYAVTWFGLAAALAGVYAAMVIKWARNRSP